MKRRNFLKSSLAMAAAGAASGWTISSAWAQASTRPRSLVNTMLLGGADLRHLFVPPPSTTPGSYGDVFWKARQGLYNLSPWNAQTVWDNDYFHVTHKGRVFGIHKTAEWLKNQFEQGHVAIVCNVKPATNQRHDHAQLIMNTGDRNAANFELDVSGWGGRLAHVTSQGNVVSHTSSVSVFAKGINPLNRNERVVSAPDMRNIALAEPTGTGADARLSRSLMAYYARRGIQLEGTPFVRFAQHEQSLRTLGRNVNVALAGTTRPAPIASLYTSGTTGYLTQPYLGRQIGSLYDATLVGALNMRVTSMELNGWDTHKDQDTALKRLFSDLFGTGKAFDTLTSQISPDARDSMVFTITSEFGRQLGANGTLGTDHGVGTYMIVFGSAVRGDVYGEMFPQAEIPKYVNHHNYIQGLTAFERVLREVCEWVEPGSADWVFPDRNTFERESGVRLNSLFAPAFQVSGTIRDVAGAPIPSATITVADASGAVVGTAAADAAGFYSLDALIAGSYSIAGSSLRYDIPPSSFTIVDADVVCDLVGTLYSGTVSGRITTAAGVPIIGHALWDIYTFPDSTTRTDANGYYQITGIKPGNNVLINASSTQYPSGLLYFAHPGGDVVKNIILTPAFADADLDTVPDDLDNCTNVINQNQRDTNNDKFGNVCDGDLTNNMITDKYDQTKLKQAYQRYNADADLNGDGVVNESDMAILQNLMGKPPGPSGLVP